jgi:T5SS/PEP-CTERM-associated repeat protein
MPLLTRFASHLPPLRGLRGIVTAAVLSTVFAGTASAATRDWTGSSSYFWSTAANWSGSAVPGNGDDVTIDMASSKAPALDSGNGAASSVYIGSTAGSSGKLSVQNSGNLSVGNLVHVGEYGNGVLAVQAGGTLVSTDGVLAEQAGSSSLALIDGAGSSWQMSGFLTVGGAGPATLSISNGASVSDHGSNIAKAVGAPATVLVDGAGSAWATGSVVIGAADAANMTIRNGGVLLATGAIYLGSGSTGVGVLNIGADAGSPPAVPGTVSVGQKLFFGTAAQSGDMLVFNHTGSNYAFTPSLSEYTPGSFGTIKVLAGVTHLSANSVGYQGVVQISGGTLSVDNVLGGNQVTVGSTGTLAGSGILTAPVSVTSGGRLAPGGMPGTLTTGPLNLAGGAQLDYDLGTPGVVGGNANDLIVVNGVLVLAGTLNINSTPGFVPGTYRLMNYTGSLTDNGLQLGTLPPGFAAAQMKIDTSTPGQVNLVVSAAAGSPALSVAPASLNWTNIPAGSGGGAQSVTLTNTGTAPLTVSLVSLPSTPFAASGGTCPAPPIVLAPNAGCTLAYDFHPAATGSFNSTITLTSNAPTSLASFVLTGTAVAGRPAAAVPAPMMSPATLFALAALLGGGAWFRRYRELRCARNASRDE